MHALTPHAGRSVLAASALVAAFLSRAHRRPDQVERLQRVGPQAFAESPGKTAARRAADPDKAGGAPRRIQLRQE